MWDAVPVTVDSVYAEQQRPWRPRLRCTKSPE